MGTNEQERIRILIADPDLEARDDIETILKKEDQFDLLASCDTGLEAVRCIEALHPDVVFVETELPDMSGFEVLKKIKPVHDPRFIFITTNALLAINAFEHQAFDYIMKPLTSARLRLSLIKVKRDYDQKSELRLQDKLNALFRYVHMRDRKPEPEVKKPGMIPVKNGNRIQFVMPDNIEYIVASGYYIEIYCNGKKHLVRESLKEMDDRLSGLGFLRIHRSVVINLRHLSEITKSATNDFSVRMSDGSSFKISKSYKADVFEHVGLGS